MTKNIRTIKLSSVQYPMLRKEDIQFLQRPWIDYGRDNLFPLWVLDLMFKSPTHNSIQTGKIELAYGEGLTWDENEKTQFDINVINKLYNKPNADEDLNEILEKLLIDATLFHGYALQIIWSKDRQTIAEIYHVPFESIRMGRPDKETNDINEYYISNDWTNWRRKMNKPEAIKKFDINDRKEARQLIYVQGYFPNQIYTQPAYIASAPYILLDYEIGQSHLNAIYNGLSPNFVLSVNSGIPSEDEQDEFVDDVKANLTGSKGQKVMVTFSEGKDQAPEILPIQILDEHEKYTTLNEAVVQNLLTANRLTSPMLLGIKTEGQLGGSNEIENAFDLYYNQVIKKTQKFVLKTLNKILKINGSEDVEFKIIKPNLLNSKLSETVIEKILTVNELRTMAGHEELENEGDNRL
jgi:hypothetical protein